MGIFVTVGYCFARKQRMTHDTGCLIRSFMKSSNDTLTVTFNIIDKEKFSEFHKKILTLTAKETEECVKDIGAHAIISSWSNPFDERDNLEAAVNFALEKLDYDDAEICEMISDGLTKEEAERKLEESND